MIEELPSDLVGLNAETLLQANNIPDMDNLDELLSQVPNPDDVVIPDSTAQSHLFGNDMDNLDELLSQVPNPDNAKTT